MPNYDDDEKNPFADPKTSKNRSTIGKNEPQSPPPSTPHNFRDATPLPVPPTPEPPAIAPSSSTPPSQHSQSPPASNAYPSWYKPSTPTGSNVSPSDETAPWADSIKKQQTKLEKAAVGVDRTEPKTTPNPVTQPQLPATERINNFPPLPSCFPVRPCFFQDISVEIPEQFRKLVKAHYGLWIAYCCVIGVNMFVSLAFLAASTQYSVNTNAGTTFGVSIAYVVVTIPSSFVCCFRPIYKAFRADSSCHFFLYFLAFLIHIGANILRAIGIDNLGTVGFINGFNMLSSKAPKPLGGCMVIVGCLFAALAVLQVLLLKKVHGVYRSTGATFTKAQTEFKKELAIRSLQSPLPGFAFSTVANSTRQNSSLAGSGDIAPRF